LKLNKVVSDVYYSKYDHSEKNSWNPVIFLIFASQISLCSNNFITLRAFFHRTRMRRHMNIFSTRTCMCTTRFTPTLDYWRTPFPSTLATYKISFLHISSIKGTDKNSPIEQRDPLCTMGEQTIPSITTH